MVDFNTDTLRRNRKIFLNFTCLRRRCAYELNPEKASIAFEIIPMLLSLNEPELPGYVPGAEYGCGIYDVGSAKNIRIAINNFFPETRKRKISYQRHLIKKPVIDSLFLMGSIGTVAQNEKSDYDFWVCTDKKRQSGKIIDILQLRTEKISRWCQSRYHMEVHFFIMDVKDIRNDDFGRVDEESAGSSQKTFLKEEFYRTLLLVSGKVPFWWVLPPQTDPEDYTRFWQRWVQHDAYDVDDFIDLGSLGDVPREEFLGTTLWHLSKGIKDPFKSLIKMTMMERYLSANFNGPMLCDVIKKRVHDGHGSLRNFDPYLLMIETVLDFYRQSGEFERLELLRKAFYIKSNPQINRLKLISRNSNYRIDVFKELLKSWDWSLDLCEDLNQIESWSYARHLKLSAELNNFFFSIYKQLREALIGQEKQSINDHDLTLLGRKLYVLFAKRKNKLQLTPFIKKDGLVLDRCIFRLGRDALGKIRWFLFDATKYMFEEPNKKSIILNSRRVARAAAWLVINGLFDMHKTVIEMPPNPSGLNVNDLIELIRHIQGFFMPALYPVKMSSHLQHSPRYHQIMLVVDLEKDRENPSNAMTDLIYNNTWGEIFTEAYPLQDAISIVKDNLSIDDPRQLTDTVRIHIPKSAQAIHFRNDIYEAILPGGSNDERLRKPPAQQAV